MVEVTIDSIRVSLMSQHRVAILKDVDGERFLPIWIGPCEADAITVRLQEVEVARPITHDLLFNLIGELGAKVEHVLIRELRNDVFLAHIVLNLRGTRMEVDSRPSDALAFAVRADTKIYVDDVVMQTAGITPESDIEAELGSEEQEQRRSAEEATPSVFTDFVDTLDFGDEDDGGKKS